MAIRGGQEIIVVDIVKEVYDIYKEKSSKLGQTAKTYINELLRMEIEKREMMRLHASHLELMGCGEHVLYIKDRKKNIIVEVGVNDDGGIRCNYSNPLYLEFAYSLPEIVKIRKKP